MPQSESLVQGRVVDVELRRLLRALRTALAGRSDPLEPALERERELFGHRNGKSDRVLRLLLPLGGLLRTR